jgi:tRNA (guanine-N7-)-methyltransferase
VSHRHEWPNLLYSAFVLKPGEGKLYCITDVKELHEWHAAKCDAHPLFRRLEGEELEKDPCVQAMITETEEGQKVARNGGSKYYAAYQRIANDQAASVDADSFFSKAPPVA